MAKILKKGDKGEDIKVLQRALGVNADGDFGTQTEAKVKAFQKSKGLSSDGIVGPATLKALGITLSESKTIQKTDGIDIKLMPITRNITKRARVIKYIVVHYTAGSSSTEGNAVKVRNLFQTSGRGASADFCVDDKTIVQVNPDIKNYYCWAVGDGKGKYGVTNMNSVSIEMCSTLKRGTSVSKPNHTGWSLTDDVVDNTVKLVKYLMNKLNIPADRVIRHYDASRKSCPGILGWNNGNTYDENGNSLRKPNDSSEWNKFKERIK